MTLAHVFSCEFCEISMNTFSYRAPLVAASVLTTTERFVALESLNNIRNCDMFIPATKITAKLRVVFRKLSKIYDGALFTV